MQYALEIIRVTQDGRQAEHVCATGGFCDGLLTLRYSYDNSEYILEISEMQLRHSRSGDIALEMRFCEGESTLATLSSGGHTGGFELYCEMLAVEFFGNNCKVKCVYSSPRGENATELLISAAKLS